MKNDLINSLREEQVILTKRLSIIEDLIAAYETEIPAIKAAPQLDIPKAAKAKKPAKKGRVSQTISRKDAIKQVLEKTPGKVFSKEELLNGIINLGFKFKNNDKKSAVEQLGIHTLCQNSA